MKINYSKLEHNVEGKSPFVGAVLHCDTSIKQHSTNITKLMASVMLNDNEGIIFIGDWHKQPLQFVELLKHIKKNDLEIMIDTDETLEDFKKAIGIASYEEVNGTKLTDIPLHDYPMFEFMGSVLIDYYLRDLEYFIEAKYEDGRRMYRIAKMEGDTNENTNNEQK